MSGDMLYLDLQVSSDDQEPIVIGFSSPSAHDLDVEASTWVRSLRTTHVEMVRPIDAMIYPRTAVACRDTVPARVFAPAA